MNEVYTLPDGWNLNKFDEIKTSNIIGLVKNQHQQSVEYSYKYVKMNNITNNNEFTFENIVNVEATDDEISKFSLSKGDLLFNTRNSYELVGKTCIFNYDLDEAILYNNNIMRIRFKDFINPYFIAYQFSSNFLQQQLNNIKSGTTNVSAIYYKTLKDIDVIIPPLEEQKRIVAKLDNLFAKIDKAIALHQKNIDEANVFMASVLNDVFVELEEKYEKIELTKYVNFSGGSQPPKSEFSNIQLDGYVRLIQIRDYKSNDNIVYVNKKSVRKFCNKDDVMIGRYGPPVFQILKGIDGAYNVALMKAEINEEYLLKEYLFNFLQNPNIQNYIIRLSQRSAGQSGVNKEALEKYLIAIPPIKTQQKVVSYLDEISNKMEKIKQIQKEKMQSLKALKASILDQAFRGEL